MPLYGSFSSSKRCGMRKERCCITHICSVSSAESAVCCFTASGPFLCLTEQRQLSKSVPPSLAGGTTIPQTCLPSVKNNAKLRKTSKPCKPYFRFRRREEQGAKLRKTAEKLLLNQLKKHALKNMSGSQQAAVLEQAQQAAAADHTPSDEIPADLLVSKRAVECASSSAP